jgi:transcriptional regulator GlxA family with amidase domain
MFVVEKGRFRYRIAGVDGEAGKGDIFFIPKAWEIAQEIIEPLRFHFIFFEWLDPRGDDESALSEFRQEAPEFKISIADQDRFFSSAESLRKIAAQGELVSKRFANHYANDLWLLGRTELRNRQLSQRLHEDSLMEKARAAIEQLAFQPMSLGEVASAHYLSGTQFTRRFQATFGVSPKLYLTSLRLEKARTLLEETEYKLEHIAELCGYESRTYLCRIFGKYMKMTPSHYRKLHKV